MNDALYFLRTGARILLLLLLFAARLCEAKEAWVEVRSPHFVAYSDAGPKEAREILRQFEEIREVFHALFPRLRVDAGQPMVILALREINGMQRFHPEGFEGPNPKRPSGIYSHRLDRDYALLRLDARSPGGQPYHVLFHEYTHGLVRLNFAALPTWLNEGLADFYGATEIGEKEVRIGRVPQGRLAQLRRSVLLSLPELLGAGHDSPHYREGDKTGVFYAQSWALVHYLLLGPEATKAGYFGAYLKALDRTNDAVAAAKEAFGDLDTFMGGFAHYVRQPVFLYQSRPLGVKPSEEAFSTRSLSPAEALVLRAEYLQRHGREAEARPLLEEARRLEPGLGAILTAEGYGHYLRKDYEAAEASFAEARKTEARDFRIPYYLAELEARKRTSAAKDPARVVELLDTSLAFNGDFAPAHALLSIAYRERPETRARAVQEARKAMELEPAHLAYRRDLGEAFLALGQESQARTVGEQLNLLAKTEGERRLAETYAARLARSSDGKEAPAP